MILSTKSAGSSALQSLLCRFAGGRHITHTRHGEMETLYWIKAAAVLGLPQVELPDSELPIPRRRAARELRHFIAQNAPGFALPIDPEQLVFQGWHELCLRHAPVFVEKSPHHLHQWSALELIERAMRAEPDIDHRFVGLVRNPMDVLYSAWTRWRTRPEVMQHHWRMAHENLRKWQEKVGAKLTVVRYEDLVSQSDRASRLFASLELAQTRVGADKYMVVGSLLKWKQDPRFGFQLDPTVAATAQTFGYGAEELENHARPAWRGHRTRALLTHRINQPIRKLRGIARSVVRFRTRPAQ